MSILKKWGLTLAGLFIAVLPSCAAMTFPNINIGLQTANTPQDFTNGLQILIWLTILTLAPSILIMTTCFVRLVVVLALTRQALGAGTLPPNQVITSLALILTFFIMAPTFNEINEKALQPYMKNQITQQVALDRGIEPIRTFMFKQTHEKELALFVRMAKIEKPKTKADVPTYVLLPSFILSELKTAFTIGFVVYLPFLVIDIVVSSVLVSMGMMFLPPTMIALPFKLIMFVMVDGWYLIVKSLVDSFVR
jgi:flagellar biosynthetic protein FliP